MGKRMVFTFGRGKEISSWLRERPRVFLDWEKAEGAPSSKRAFGEPFGPRDDPVSGNVSLRAWNRPARLSEWSLCEAPVNRDGRFRSFSTAQPKRKVSFKAL